MRKIWDSLFLWRKSRKRRRHAERARHILGPDRAIYFVYPHGATEVKRMRLPSNELDERHVADSLDDIHSLEARMAQFYAYSLPVQ